MNLTAYLYLALFDLSCIASGTALVITEHYGWAWIPFLLAATTTVRNAPSRTS